MSERETPDGQPILDIRGVSKRFDATQALDDVSLALHPGEIHALLGENGAGKSTLIKIITGVHQPDRGQIWLEGSRVTIASAAEAQRMGVAAIYQEPLLFPDLNVAENIFISHQDRGAVVGWKAMFREAEAILAELGVALDVRSPARGLTLAAQQSVEIAKAISMNVRVLIMDEPTASLSAHEAQELFRLVRDLKRQGVAILFVSHRMEEVFEIADKITVFRDGRLISTRPRAEATPQRAIADMVGREIDITKTARHVGATGTASVGGRPWPSGRVRGRQLRSASRRGARPGRADRRRAHGCRTCPVRHRAGDFGNHPARRRADHGPLAARRDEARHRLCVRGSQAARTGAADVDLRQHHLAGSASLSQPLGPGSHRPRAPDPPTRFRTRLAIRAPSVDLAVAKLSGGNQQKVMLSKWLNTNPSILILDEPTRGVDVGSKSEVHAIIGELAAEGIGVIVISSDLPEVLALSDRVLVMREGRQMAILDRADADPESVMNAAMGQTSADPIRGRPA